MDQPITPSRYQFVPDEVMAVVAGMTAEWAAGWKMEVVGSARRPKALWIETPSGEVTYQLRVVGLHNQGVSVGVQIERDGCTVDVFVEDGSIDTIIRIISRDQEGLLMRLVAAE